jgi:MFS family permease
MTSNVRLILLTVFLLVIVQTMVSVLIPLVASQEGVGAFLIGILVAVPLGVRIATDIPSAKTSDLIGRRPLLITGALVGGLGAMALLAGQTIGFLVAGSLLFGLSFSLVTGPAQAFLTEAASPRHHARIQGFNGAIQGISALTGAAAAGVVASRWGLNFAVAVTAALMAAIVLLALAIRERQRGWTRHIPRNPFQSLVRSYARVIGLLLAERNLMIAGTAALLYWFQFLIVGNAFVPVFLVRGEGFSSADAGFLLGWRSLVGAGLSLTFGFVAPRIGIVRSIVVTNALGIAGIGLVPILADSPLIIAAFALQGVGLAFGPASTNVLTASATAESERALGFSATSLLATAAGVFLPLVLGISASVGGYPGLFLVAELLGFLMVTALIVFSWRASGRAASDRAVDPW